MGSAFSQPRYKPRLGGHATVALHSLFWGDPAYLSSGLGCLGETKNENPSRNTRRGSTCGGGRLSKVCRSGRRSLGWRFTTKS